MEKLLELLNEYSKEIWYFNEEDLQWQTKAWILNKEFWWIKWLVENDKIDRKKYDRVYINTKESWILGLKDYEQLLMLLSISENPIELLISMLK